MDGPTLALDNAGPLETMPPPRVSAVAGRAEIDTSAPFESVKEAVDRFGGSAQWKSQLKQLFGPEKHHNAGEIDAMIVEEQAAQLEKDLIAKERETLDVLKELEMTKRIVDDLKLRLQKEASEFSKIPEMNSDGLKVHPILETEEHSPRNPENQVDVKGPNTGAKQSPGLILMELKQAKLNLNRTTTDLAGIRASVELLSIKIEKEKALLGKTREKLTSKNVLVSSLEEELNQTNLKLQETKVLGSNNQEKPSDISEEIKRLSSEIEQFRKMKEDSKSEVLKLTAEIEQTKASIKTAEIRWLAAKKMEEAAKAAEAVAIAEIKALTNNDNNSTVELQTPSAITLSIEDYTELTRTAQEADEISREKIEAAMVGVEKANQSKLELLKEVEKAAAEVVTSRKALEEALTRVEAANKGKLAVEEALRRWRSEQGQRRRSVHSSPKFKNSHPTPHRRDSRMLDLNGLSLVTDVPKSGMRPPLSIGQILSRKLMGPEEYELVGKHEKIINAKPKVSLGQMLSKKHGALSPQRAAEDGVGSAARKQYSAKRKKFGLVGLSLLKPKQSKKARRSKKTREAWSPR